MHHVDSVLTRARVAALAGLVLLLASCSGTTGSTLTDAGGAPTLDAGAPTLTDAFSLRSEMRRLWTDHVAWTRIYLMDAIAGLPETSLTAERLLANQSQIGDAVRPLYGDAAATKLTGLLRAHILGAADVVAAAKSGDQAAFTQAKTAWYANADDIASFLAGANPNWSLAELTANMRVHLDRTLAEAMARLRGDWAGDVAAYDAVEQHILGFADFLAAGMVKQFPNEIAPSPIPKRDENLHLGLRALWEQHVLWTRVYLVAQTASLADAPFAARRLMQNQDAIGEAFKPFYGAAGGDQLASLLRAHITGAVTLLGAYESGDARAVDAASAAWYANGEAIARYFAAANVYWPVADARAQVTRHLDLTVAEIAARVARDYPRDIRAYDAVVAHVLGFADFLADGLARQFALTR